MINMTFFFILFYNCFPSLAYLGPGMGGGIIAAIFGIIAAFFLGLWGILYYPIKRALNNKKKKKLLKSKKNER